MAKFLALSWMMNYKKFDYTTMIMIQNNEVLDIFYEEKRQQPLHAITKYIQVINEWDRVLQGEFHTEGCYGPKFKFLVGFRFDEIE
jgi:hypothetical protein